jgi:polysaccharide biosynthesis/export protein
MNRRLNCLILALAVAAGACSPRYQASEYTVAETRAPYRLAGGDRVRVIVFGQDSLSNMYVVDGVGRISMPLIDTVEAQGRTTQELERLIEGKLKTGFLREPQVSVQVDTFRPFFVLGEVANSGQFPYVNGMTVQTAIAIAGGFPPRGQQNWAELTRKVNGQFIIARVPISYTVQPGDTIVIKERWF